MGHAFASQFGEYPPFSAEEFTRAGLDSRWIPPIGAMGTAVGVTSVPWSAEAHLPDGIPVIAGVYDAIATTLGAGLVEIGLACDYGGNSGGYGLCWHEPLHAAGVNTWQGLLDNQNIVGGATANAGSSIDWFAQVFGGVDRWQQNLSEAASISAGADGVTFLPYLLGERAPLWDDELRGAFVGLALQHRYPHLLRAVFEGVAFGLRNLSDAVRGAGGQMSELRVCGGTAHYEVLNQIKADVLGVPVVVPAMLEASLLGAAILAARGVGLQANYIQAVSRMVHTARRLEPNADSHAAYEASYQKFLKLTRMRLR
jgi:xylulokinase